MQSDQTLFKSQFKSSLNYSSVILNSNQTAKASVSHVLSLWGECVLTEYKKTVSVDNVLELFIHIDTLSFSVGRWECFHRAVLKDGSCPKI